MPKKKHFPSSPKKTQGTQSSQVLLQPDKQKGMVVWGFALFVFAFILYANTLHHDYALDDLYVILSNTHVQKGTDGLKEIWTKPHWYADIQYRPLPATIFALVKESHGNNPHVGHLINVFLFSVSVVFVFLFSLRAFRVSTIIAALIAGCFATHPIHTEVVANIKSLDEILCLFFLLITAITTTRYLASSKIVWLLCGMVCYASALLSKETALPFLAVIPMIIYTSSIHNWRTILKVTFPFVVIAGLFLFVSIVAVGSLHGYSAASILNNSLSAAPTLLSRYATAILILGKYLLLLIFPHPLVYDYSYNQIPNTTFANPAVILSLLVYAALITYAIITFKRRSPFSFAILFFICMLSITSNLFIMIGATMGERFLYIPSLGFCIVAGILFQKLLEKFPQYIKVLYAGLIIILILYSIKTITRNADWKDNLTLFSHDVANAPNSAPAHGSLGNMLIITAQNEPKQQAFNHLTEAKQVLRRALSIYPQYAYAAGNLALTYSFLGQNDSAVVWFKRSVELNPEDDVARMNLGDIYFSKNIFDSATIWYTEIIKRNYQNTDCRIRLAKTQALMAMYDSSLANLSIVNQQMNGSTEIGQLIEYVNVLKDKKIQSEK